MPAFIAVNNAIEKIVDRTIDLGADTFVAVLITAAHTPDPADEIWSDISAAEATGTGYTAGGQGVDPLTISRVDEVTTIDCATNPLWATATVSAKSVYIVRQAGGSLSSGDLIVGYMDLNASGGNLSSVGADFEVTWPVNGLFTLARAG